MKLKFSNDTDVNWEAIQDNTPSQVAIPLPSGDITTAELQFVLGTHIFFGPVGDGFPYGVNRVVNAGDANTVFVITAAVLQADGSYKVVQADYDDPPPAPPEP